MGICNWEEFLYSISPSLNGTPSPSFIGYKKLGIWMNPRPCMAGSFN
jgi:hypothetical protein